MNRRWTHIGLIAALAAVAMLLRDRHERPESPAAAVHALFDAAARGDESTYLRLVSGPLRASLLATRSRIGDEAFRQDLLRSASGIKGVSVPLLDSAPADEIVLEIEIVFEDRKERQEVTVAREKNGWAVVSMGSAETEVPEIRYGTSVAEE